MAIGEVLEDEVTDDAAQGAADRRLAVEERQAAAEFKARVEEGEVRHGDGVETSCRRSVDTFTMQLHTQRRATATFQAPNDYPQREQLPPPPHPDMQHRRQPPQQHARRHPSHHAIPPTQCSARRLEGDKEGEEEGDGRVEVALLEPNVCREVRRLCIANLQNCSLAQRCL